MVLFLQNLETQAQGMYLRYHFVMVAGNIVFLMILPDNVKLLHMDKKCMRKGCLGKRKAFPHATQQRLASL